MYFNWIRQYFEEDTYKYHSTASRSAISSTGIFIEVSIIIVVIILALGTDGIAMAATVTKSLKKIAETFEQCVKTTV